MGSTPRNVAGSADLAGVGGALRLSPILDATPELHHALITDGWEGTVAKRTNARYRCGHRSNA